MLADDLTGSAGIDGAATGFWVCVCGAEAVAVTAGTELDAADGTTAAFLVTGVAAEDVRPDVEDG
jgi:hypothetical protein